MNDKRIEMVVKLMEDFSNLVNILNDGEISEVMYENLKTKHRTLQQGMVRAMLGVIERIGTDENYRTDPRNEGSKKVCKQLVDTFQKEVNPTNQNREHYMPSKWLGYV